MRKIGGDLNKNTEELIGIKDGVSGLSLLSLFKDRNLEYDNLKKNSKKEKVIRGVVENEGASLNPEPTYLEP